VVDALDEVAAETGKTMPQVAINWLLTRPTVSSVIIGARNEAQLRQNLGAVGWTPDRRPGRAARRRQRPRRGSPGSTRRRYERRRGGYRA
jgi:aryl-alcohol dehydrogenase-like predicted oxidoreductase